MGSGPGSSPSPAGAWSICAGVRRGGLERQRTSPRIIPTAVSIRHPSWRGTTGTEAAQALIGTLPHDQAEVVLLRVVAGLDVKMVAHIVGKRPGTVRVLAHRGLRKLALDLAARTDRSGSSDLA